MLTQGLRRLCNLTHIHSILSKQSQSFCTKTITTNEPAIAANIPNNLPFEEDYRSEIDFIKQKHKFNAENKQRLTGLVVSDKCSKSISVQIKHFKYVKKYNASIPIRNKIMAHDEFEAASLGDIVTIVPCRPMSRKKRHKLLTIVKKYRRIEDHVDTSSSSPDKKIEDVLAPV